MVKIAFLTFPKEGHSAILYKKIRFCFNIKNLSTFSQIFLRVYRKLYQKNYLPGKTGTENSSFGWTRVKKSVNLKKSS